MKKTLSLFLCLIMTMSFVLAGEPPCAPPPELTSNDDPPVFIMVFNPVLGAPTDQPGSSGHVGSIFDGPGCFDTNPSSGYGELEVRFINQSYFRINCNRCTADVQSVEMVNRTTGERTGAYPARNGVVTIRPINPYGSWVIRTYCATGSCYSASVSVN